MRKRIASVALALGVLASLLITAPANAVTDNGTGIFWVYNSTNGTGEYRDFNVGPSQTITLSGLRFTGSCPSTGCGYLNNNISSVRLSCGSAGSSFSSLDYVNFYGGDTPSGTAYKVSRGSRTCSNGTILVTFDLAHTNWASSMVTHNG